MTTPDIPGEPAAAGTPANLAEWGTRALGGLIDWGAYIVVIVIVYLTPLRWFGGLFGTLYLIYLGYLDGLTGQTPGKVVMGIRVVDAKGELLGAGLGIGRKFAHILDFIICGLGFLLPIVDAQKQTIADKVVTTYVVTGAEKKPFAIDLWFPPKQPQ